MQMHACRERIHKKTFNLNFFYSRTKPWVNVCVSGVWVPQGLSYLLTTSIASRSCIQQDTFYVQVEKYDSQTIGLANGLLLKILKHTWDVFAVRFFSNFKPREWSSGSACWYIIHFQCISSVYFFFIFKLRKWSSGSACWCIIHCLLLPHPTPP